MIPNRSMRIPDANFIPRRTFVQLSTQTVAAGLATLALPSMGLPTSKLQAASEPNQTTIRLGFMADLHQDLVPDATARLDQFLEMSLSEKPAALIQLGDFATPITKNKDAIERYNSVDIKKYHVIGNHDTDGGLKIAQVVDTWGMKARFYSDIVQGLKLIVLDCNDKPKNHRGGYPAHIADDQLEWLKEELQYPGPILVLSHQPLAGPAAIDNSVAVQKLLSTASDRILLAINGHTHIDELLEVEGVRYWHVNSASYYWVGSQYKHESFPREVHAKYPAMSSTCPYRNPLFAFLEIDFARGLLTMIGRESDWIGPSPSDLGLPSNPQITPRIRARSQLYPSVESVKKP
jgi:3',5'-cyclic-AMP phosphodiesterase